MYLLPAVVTGRVVTTVDTSSTQIVTGIRAAVTLAAAAGRIAPVSALTLVAASAVHVGVAHTLAGARLAEVVPGTNGIAVTGWRREPRR